MDSSEVGSVAVGLSEAEAYASLDVSGLWCEAVVLGEENKRVTLWRKEAMTILTTQQKLRSDICQSRGSSVTDKRIESGGREELFQIIAPQRYPTCLLGCHLFSTSSLLLEGPSVMRQDLGK